MSAEDAGGVSRRGFLGWLSAGLGGIVAAVLGGAGGAYFLAPAFSDRQENWVDLGPAKDVPVGTPVKIDFVVRKRDAWATTEQRSSAYVTTSNGKDFIVFDPRCTHLGCPYRWNEIKKQFICPCHTAVFDVDGHVVQGPPPRGLDRYEAKVTGGRLLILPRPVKARA